MSSTPPKTNKTKLFPKADASEDASTHESPWADRPFVIKTVRSIPSVRSLDPIPSAKTAAATPVRTFVERPPHPLLKSNAALSPLPIMSPADKARKTQLTAVGKAPE